MLETELNTPIENSEDPIGLAIRKYRIDPSDVLSASISHRSFDIRPGRPAVYAWQIRFELNREEMYLRRMKNRARKVTPFRYAPPSCGERLLPHRPVIIGFGPCGMAAGLLLARLGYEPLILERGAAMEERKKAVDRYWTTGMLDPERNVQFGEGGAGAFSDGKLTTRVKDPRITVVLEALIHAGADPSIAWMNHPHIGTDRFRDIDVHIRNEIISLGGEVRFDTRLDDLVLENGAVRALITAMGEEIPCEVLILAVGHSARDTFRMLEKRKMLLSPKNFAVGLRIEHLQSFINARQYRSIRDYSSLPAAEYRLSYTSSLNKGVYSFCMCPGGYVVAAAGTPETSVTNGMSYHARDGRNANSALIVQVNETDYGTGLFSGMRFQEELEKKAFLLGKGKAPAERVDHYLGKPVCNEPSDVKPTYPLGVEMCDLHELLSDPLNRSLEEMLVHTEEIFPGFTDGSLFTGVETRTSSPLRMERNKTSLQSSIEGIYPAGEGAGYAGGIVSSAIDGIRSAEKIIEEYRPRR
jgi:uncharacterized FAD-dependent dehydrogenase